MRRIFTRQPTGGGTNENNAQATGCPEDGYGLDDIADMELDLVDATINNEEGSTAVAARANGRLTTREGGDNDAITAPSPSTHANNTNSDDVASQEDGNESVRECGSWFQFIFYSYF